MVILELKVIQSAEERTPVAEAVEVARLKVNWPVEVVIERAGPEAAKVKDGPKTPLMVEVEPAPPVALIVTFPDEEEMVTFVPAVMALTPEKLKVVPVIFMPGFPEVAKVKDGPVTVVPAAEIVVVTPCLLLKVIQSAEERYPF